MTIAITSDNMPYLSVNEASEKHKLKLEQLKPPPPVDDDLTADDADKAVIDVAQVYDDGMIHDTMHVSARRRSRLYDDGMIHDTMHVSARRTLRTSTARDTTKCHNQHNLS